MQILLHHHLLHHLLQSQLIPHLLHQDELEQIEEVRVKVEIPPSQKLDALPVQASSPLTYVLISLKVKTIPQILAADQRAKAKLHVLVQSEASQTLQVWLSSKPVGASCSSL